MLVEMVANFKARFASPEDSCLFLSHKEAWTIAIRVNDAIC
jgi:hypothetical protein